MADRSMTTQILGRCLRFYAGTSGVSIGKPLEGSSGQGIIKYDENAWNEEWTPFLSKLKSDGIGILEEVVVQHPKMASHYAQHPLTHAGLPRCSGDKQQGIVYAFLPDR